MHLFKKCLKYVFAYALMQMHNYPKPSNKVATSKIDHAMNF